MAAEKMFNNISVLRVYLEKDDAEKFKEAVRRNTGRTSAVSEVIREFCLGYIRESGRK